MRNVSAIGVDLSKSVIHVHAADRSGSLLWRKKVRAEHFSEILAQLPQGSTVYMEACGSSHFWSRKAERFGVKPRQISPQHVKPFVKSQKNDYHDAEAVLEAGRRPSMRYVSTKSEEQQELQALHNIRSRRVAQRTALINQMRGILLEHGVAVAQGPARLKRYLRAEFLTEPELSPAIRRLIEELQAELSNLEAAITEVEQQMRQRVKASAMIRRLLTIPGVGLLSATALAVVCGDPKQFKNGRQFAALLGLVPRQFSTGGKTTLRGITKRGNVYVRMLLIHGARAVIRHALKKEDPHSLWIRKLYAAKGMNLTAVAVANKNARIAWRLMTTNDEYDPALPHAPFVIQ